MPVSQTILVTGFVLPQSSSVLSSQTTFSLATLLPEVHGDVAGCTS